MRSRSALWFAIAAATLVSRRSGAERGDEDRPRRYLQAVRVDSALVVDGVLDDDTWQRAWFSGDFVQRTPREGAPLTSATHVAFAYDDEALYVGARMAMAAPGDVRKVMTRRDDTGTAEHVVISLDTYRDGGTAYSFAVTAAGVKADWFHSDDDIEARDYSYSPVWDARVNIGDDTWTVELRIPFSQLRFRAGGDQVWGVNVVRVLPQHSEEDYWAAIPANDPGWSSWFGELHGVTGARSTWRLELQPYVTTEATLVEPALVEPADPLTGATNLAARVGGDLKLGLSPSVTVEGTIRPDFGQVEADPALVNLSAFEPMLDEHRPFFSEGLALLEGHGHQYFYSRRIGRAPRGRVDGAFAQVPGATTILGAVKLTGRLRDGRSFGALAALTDEAVGTAVDETTGDVARVALEPLTSYGVGRFEQELGDDVVGVSAAAVVRDLGTDALRAALVREAYSGGVDWRFRFADSNYELGGFAGASLVRGSPDAVARVQRASAHYFTRPDQDHVSYNPARGSMSGWTGAVTVAKRSGRWRWDSLLFLESPGLELNDAGLLASADEISARLGVRYLSLRPGLVLQGWEVGCRLDERWNFGGVRLPGSLRADMRGTWLNQWTTTLDARVHLPGLDDRITRGGPLMELGPGVEVGAEVATNPASTFQAGVGGRLYDQTTGQTGFVVIATLAAQPAERVRVELAPRYVRTTNHRQYVATLDEGRDATFGQRFVFAAVSQREIAAQLRMELALSPTLAIDAYVEPFASSGRYAGLGELAAPRARALRVYGEAPGTTLVRTPSGYAVQDGDRSFELSPLDFTSLSMRSTLVIRWELIPHATLFVVWQQDRKDELARALALDPTDVREAVTAPGRHIVAVKLSYWWSPI